MNLGELRAFNRGLLLEMATSRIRAWVLSLVNRPVLALRSAARSALRISARAASLLPRPLLIVLHYVTQAAGGERLLRTRRYLAPNLDLDGLFRTLRDREVRYVVLRWFEDLPSVALGEDLDLLIDDGDVHKLSGLFSAFRVGQSFDVYSVSGRSGTDYAGLPYYPPHLAELILGSRTWLRDLYAVPDAGYHFLSLAYHAVYHKGQASGLPWDGRRPAPGDHDYAAILQRLADGLGVQLELTYVGVHDYLQGRHWSPNMDTLRKLVVTDPWKQSLLPAVSDVQPGEFMVFVLREWIRENGRLKSTVDLLRNGYLDILLVHELSNAERGAAQRLIRGGKWDRGPFPVSGGPPYAVVACFDHNPKPLGAEERTTYPYARNQNILLKHRVRDQINEQMLWIRWVNSIHAADDETEAWDYLRSALPECERELREAVRKRRDTYYSDHKVLKTLRGYQRRAKVEVIEFGDLEAVKKTFKVGFERFCAREVCVYEHPRLKECVPELLETGPNYFITRYVGNALERRAGRGRRALLRRHGGQIVDAMRAFYNEGYAIIGFFPGNVIITEDGDVKIVDFEFLYEYSERPSSFLKSYDIVGTPPDFDGDLPYGMLPGDKGHTYSNTWHREIGPLEAHLHELERHA